MLRASVSSEYGKASNNGYAKCSGMSHRAVAGKIGRSQMMVFSYVKNA